jgi:hypothetical protein
MLSLEPSLEAVLLIKLATVEFASIVSSVGGSIAKSSSVLQDVNVSTTPRTNNKIGFKVFIINVLINQFRFLIYRYLGSLFLKQPTKKLSQEKIDFFLFIFH